jgi:type II secretory pathway component GspD/PulD (secretin)
LIITITPRVVTDNQQARDVTAEFRKKLTGMRKLNEDAAAAPAAESSSSMPAEGGKSN